MPAHLCLREAFGTQKLVELTLFYRRTLQNKPHQNSTLESAGRDGVKEKQNKEAKVT